MANVFANLPPTAGDGVGLGVDTSTMGRDRTITVDGTFNGTVTIEFSLVGTGGPWAQLTTLAAPGKRTLPTSGAAMRVRRAGVPTLAPGLPNVDVSSDDVGGEYLSFVVPAGNGTGASIDTSALGTFNVVSCLGTFTGAVVVEISLDNVSFIDCFTFTQAGDQTKLFTAQFMRVTRKGVGPVPGTPQVDVGAINDAMSATSAAGAILTWGGGIVGSGVDTRFLFPGSQPGTIPLTQDGGYGCPRAGTLQNFFARHNTANGNGTAVTYDIDVNGVPSGLALSLVTGAIGQSSDTTTTIAVVQGDTLGATITKTGLIGLDTINATFACELV